MISYIHALMYFITSLKCIIVYNPKRYSSGPSLSKMTVSAGECACEPEDQISDVQSLPHLWQVTKLLGLMTLFLLGHTLFIQALETVPFKDSGTFVDGSPPCCTI